MPAVPVQEGETKEIEGRSGIGMSICASLGCC
jgi:hypothetical protein